MGALLWLLVPVLAALIATVWSTWTQRTRKSGDGAELAGYARFREAMEREHSASDPASDAA
ncbi:hypothetical protein ACWC2K_21970 [Streptomyces chattanoogensis]|uniref:Uncharacterized protein n=1 Tax=Streptomyces chattanoogensis TaxID=66876 RepID=A0A0N0Y051_9ACTN|nr:hypothetical protein [Streptomyces chattanoogensis]AJT64517.1 hypothetical protein T261_2846 [Streptomyces lydicus]KPC66863.1 hypothetical protein ADL29_01330 [Streptomyces chattanoogensis]